MKTAPMKTKVLTANRLSDGIAVWLGANGEWTVSLKEAFLARHEDAVRDVLGLAPYQGVAAMVCLGVPDRFPTRLTRRPVEAFVTIDRVDGPALST